MLVTNTHMHNTSSLPPPPSHPSPPHTHTHTHTCGTGAGALSEVDPAALKQMYHGVTTVILECAKRNVDTDNAGQALEDAQVPSSRVGVFTGLYGKCLNLLREILFSASFNYPHVVDAQWRLDYLIQDSNLLKIDEMTYSVALVTETGGDLDEDVGSSSTASLLNLGSAAPSSLVGSGGGRRVEFTCSREQLEDLAITFRDATEQMARIVDDS